MSVELDEDFLRTIPEIFQPFAQAVARRANPEYSPSDDIDAQREHLSKLITEYNRKYGGAIQALLDDKGYSKGLLVIDDDASAARWKASYLDRAAHGDGANHIKIAINRLWNKDDYAPETPGQLFLASMRIEFASRVAMIKAHDTFPLDSEEEFELDMGRHMLDPDTETEFARDEKHGMSQLACEIMVVANALRETIKNSPHPHPSLKHDG